MSALQRRPARAIVATAARLALIALAWMFSPSEARADLFDAPVLVIEPGREPEVLALFAPSRPGTYPLATVRFDSVSIRAADIRAVLEAPADAGSSQRYALVLAARGLAPPPGFRPLGDTLSFSLSTDAPREGPFAQVLTSLTSAVRAHDRGGFFRARAAAAVESSRGAPARGSLAALRAWLTDGLLFVTALTVLTFALLWREARRGGRPVVLALCGVLLLSAALRVGLSVEAALDVWPYSRLGPLPRMVFRGPLLSLVARDRVVTLSSVIFALGLFCSIVSPVALYAHARPLLGSQRAALAACFALCVLPAHLRFSHSDTGYIPSAWLTALAFALVHQAAHARARWLRALALAMLPPVWLLELDVRPLNVLFAPFALADVWLLEDADATREVSPRTRATARITASAVVLATLAYYLFTGYLSHNRAQINEGLSARSLARGVLSLVVPWRNTLLHPYVTPTGVLALAIYGAYALWKQGGRARRLAVFLPAWLVAFYVFHGIVQPPVLEMQARYHLQLATPLVLLTGVGLATLARTRRRVAAAAVVYLALTPLLHLRFVRDVRFDDVREYAFVRAQSQSLARGCTVLEYDWPDGMGRDLRFRRVATELERGEPSLRLSAISLANPAREGNAEADALSPNARAILASPPPCLYFYEGLACATQLAGASSQAPVCAAVHEALGARLERVAHERLDGRPYDDHYRAPPGTQPTLSLYRVR